MIDTFDFLESNTERLLLSDAFQAVTAAGLWDWFARTESLDRSQPEMERLEAHMKHMNRQTSVSYGWTMNTMRQISRDGFEAWKAAAILRQNEEKHNRLVQKLREKALKDGLEQQRT